MRQTPNQLIDKYRETHPQLGPSEPGENYGYFRVQSPLIAGPLLNVIASDGQCGEKWEHVSVSLPGRTPTWEEMCFVRDLFWGPEETVIQFRPPQSRYVNFHEHCLHLRRLRGFKQPLPPTFLVGPK